MPHIGGHAVPDHGQVPLGHAGDKIGLRPGQQCCAFIDELAEGSRADYRGTAGRVGRDIGKQLLQPLESGRAEAGQGVDS